MRLLVVLSLVSLAIAVPQQGQSDDYYKNAQILRYDAYNDGYGSWNYVYEQSDNQRANAEGELKNAGTDNEAISVKGSYSWVGPDGVTYTVNYIADENGYQPTIEQGPGGGVPPGVVASLLG